MCLERILKANNLKLEEVEKKDLKVGDKVYIFYNRPFSNCVTGYNLHEIDRITKVRKEIKDKDGEILNSYKLFKSCEENKEKMKFAVKIFSILATLDDYNFRIKYDIKLEVADEILRLIRENKIK
jgi:hypothetical protein